MSRTELRRHMGDLNDDGIVSASEVLNALEDGHGEAIDDYFIDAHGASLREYLRLREENPGRDAEIAEAVRVSMQAGSEQHIREARANPDNRALNYALASLSRIEIPADIERLVRDLGVGAVDVPDNETAQVPVTVASAAPARTHTGRA